MGKASLIAFSVGISASLFLTMQACKPSGPGGAAVKDILGETADGKKAAITLVPVRNVTTAAIPNAPERENGTSLRRAIGSFNYYFFALAECVEMTKNGQTIGPEKLTALLDGLGQRDQLYVNANRQFITDVTADNDAKLAGDVQLYGAKEGEFMSVPTCTLVGNRLVNYDVMDEIDGRVAELPETQPKGADEQAARRLFMTKQMLHLAMRGNYSKNPAKENLYKFGTAALMLAQARQIDVSTFQDQVMDGLRAGDVHYNPCVETDTSSVFGYLADWKAQNFTCATTDDKEIFAYMPRLDTDGAQTSGCDWPSGASRLGYQRTKDMWTCEVDASYERINAEIATFPMQFPRLQALREMLSMSQPWAQASGDNADLGAYLATGKAANGFNFTKYFSQKGVKNGAAGLALADTGTLTKPKTATTTPPKTTTPKTTTQAPVPPPAKKPPPAPKAPTRDLQTCTATNPPGKDSPSPSATASRTGLVMIPKCIPEAARPPKKPKVDQATATKPIVKTPPPPPKAGVDIASSGKPAAVPAVTPGRPVQINLPPPAALPPRQPKSPSIWPSFVQFFASRPPMQPGGVSLPAGPVGYQVFNSLPASGFGGGGTFGGQDKGELGIPDECGDDPTCGAPPETVPDPNQPAVEPTEPAPTTEPVTTGEPDPTVPPEVVPEGPATTEPDPTTTTEPAPTTEAAPADVVPEPTVEPTPEPTPEPEPEPEPAPEQAPEE